ncbi:MAG: hormogonium polysaccharide biosynthesis glycosyltransferase HpsE [Cyanobacteria bacterium P01_F01_bin.116]
MDITVAICTYNGASRVGNVLDKLAIQSMLTPINWEVIVVDNNSHDETVNIVRNYQESSHLDNKIKYFFESRQGLAYARRRAVQSAKGSLIAFLDDDNLPDSHWVQSVYDFGQQYPEAGAYGSQICGAYESELPKDFERIACFLAVIDRGQYPFRYDLLDRWLFPAGAGLVVRRQAWLSAVPEQPRLSGVSGKKLTGKGEDIETLSYIRKAGWQIWHNPDMRVDHIISCDRMSASYLLALFRGVGLSRHHTRMIRFQQWQRPFATIAYGLNDLRRWLLYYPLHYHEKSEIVVRCELTLLFYSLLSPFYVLLKPLMNVISQRYQFCFGIAGSAQSTEVSVDDGQWTADIPKAKRKHTRRV